MTSSTFAELEPNLEPLGPVSGFVDEFVDAVKPQALFAGFSREETSSISRYLDCYGVPTQSVVIREGDEGDFMAILVTGRAMIVKEVDGVEKIMYQLKPGDMIGEMSLVDGQRRFASCVSTEPSDFAVLTNAKLTNMLREQPALGNKFLLLLLRLYAERMRPAIGASPTQFMPKSV
jgi:CRP-like cAMP-binding protein